MRAFVQVVAFAVGILATAALIVGSVAVVKAGAQERGAWKCRSFAPVGGESFLAAYLGDAQPDNVKLVATNQLVVACVRTDTIP